MDVIFDIRSHANWAEDLNEEIRKDFPNYFDENPLLGSEEWWSSIDIDVSNGKIMHVGHYLEDGALMDIVSIQPLNDEMVDLDYGSAQQPEYSVLREDYWINDKVSEGKYVSTKSVTIMPSGELDENSLYIELEVSVW